MVITLDLTLLRSPLQALPLQVTYSYPYDPWSAFRKRCSLCLCFYLHISRRPSVDMGVLLQHYVLHLVECY